MDAEALHAGLISVTTWALTGLLRWLAPGLWRKLDKRQFRLSVIALVAVASAVGSGVMQGLGAVEITKLSIGALAGSVLIRQFTKGERLMYDGETLSRPVNLR